MSKGAGGPACYGEAARRPRRSTAQEAAVGQYEES